MDSIQARSLSLLYDDYLMKCDLLHEWHLNFWLYCEFKLPLYLLCSTLTAVLFHIRSFLRQRYPIGH